MITLRAWWIKRKFVAAAGLIDLMDEDEELRRKRGKTRAWIRRRDEKGFFNNIVRELMLEDTVAYREMMRMSYSDFSQILSHDNYLRLIYTSEVSGDGDRSGDVRCLRSCVNQMKETEAETDTDAKFDVLSPSRA